MSNLILHREQPPGNAIVLPPPRGGDISIRLAELGGGDLKFIDDLQRKHARMVGWFPTKQLETNITKGKILIAEEYSPLPLGEGLGVRAVSAAGALGDTNASVAICPHPGPLPKGEGVRVGYCISHDRYFKRDDCGIVYQLNVVPTKHRGLIGASLIKEVFNRAAYGCKLFCCWCAQDLQANYFWESLGFVPLAFRTGSRPRLKKDGTVSKPERIHIFWQRRIREGDTETPYWFPSETSGGAVKENRLVLPLPPGTSWQDAKPAILPGMENVNVLPPGAQDKSGGVKKSRAGGGGKKVQSLTPVPKKPAGGLWFTPPAPPKPAPGSPEEKAAKEAEKAAKKAAKPKREKFKNDPKMVEAARELRDRYIEQINAGLLLPPSANGKYEVSRQLEAAPSAMQMESPGIAPAMPMLEAA